MATKPVNKKDLKNSELKWGKEAISHGFNIIPALLFRYQNRLGLTSPQLVVLLHLIDHWWDESRNPWPGVQAIATRMNLQRRQVQRIMGSSAQRYQTRHRNMKETLKKEYKHRFSYPPI